MSVEPLRCEECHLEMSFSGLERADEASHDEQTTAESKEDVPSQDLAGADDHGPAVALICRWSCPRCQAQRLDRFALPTLLPMPQDCPRCGAREQRDQARCQSCAISAAAATLLLDLQGGNARRVEESFARGLFLRGLCQLDEQLREQPTQGALWSRKMALLTSLRYWRAAAAMIRAAVERGAPEDLFDALAAQIAQRAGQEAQDSAQALAVLRWTLSSASLSERPRASLLCAQAGLLASQGDGEQAEQLWARAREICPGLARAYLMPLQHLFAASRWSDALQICQGGLEALVPPEGEGHGEERDEDETRAVALRGELHCISALAHCERLDGDRALACAQRALELVPGSARALYARGRAEAMLGQLERAQASMERVLEIEPQSNPARLALSMILRAQR